MTFKMLLQVCVLFWSLSKPGQDALLWSLQGNAAADGGTETDESASDDSSDVKQHHVKWYIGGTQVCRRSFLRMLGVGCGRVKRTRDTFKGLDNRHLAGRSCFHDSKLCVCVVTATKLCFFVYLTV